MVNQCFHSLQLSLIRLYYVTWVGRRAADGLLCLFSANHHEVGQVAGRDGEERKIKKGIKGGDSRLAYVELSDFDKKYYDLHLKGLISRKHYEQSRLLHLMYMETTPENKENGLQ